MPEHRIAGQPAPLSEAVASLFDKLYPADHPNDGEEASPAQNAQLPSRGTPA